MRDIESRWRAAGSNYEIGQITIHSKGRNSNRNSWKRKQQQKQLETETATETAGSNYEIGQIITIHSKGRNFENNSIKILSLASDPQLEVRGRGLVSKS